MANQDLFKSQEADKLANWMSQTLSTKEARTSVIDQTAASRQRTPVTVQTQETVVTNNEVSIPCETENRITSSGLTEDEVRRMLEPYATQEWVESLLEDYATIEYVDENFLKADALDGYATEAWVEGKDYATQSWVEDRIKNFVTKDELENYVSKEEICNVIRDNFGCHFTDEFELLARDILRDVDNKLRELGVAAECSEGNVTVTLTGIP